jgi:hypothetical protein
MFPEESRLHVSILVGPACSAIQAGTEKRPVTTPSMISAAKRDQKPALTAPVAP